MSINRLPKYSYYFFQSQRPASAKNPAYPSGPMVFIASDWTADSAKQVRVFSNADQVELWLNQQLVARQSADQNSMSDKLKHPPFTFHLDKFAAGTLTAKAFIAGKLEATHQVTTPGKPHKLRLRLEPLATTIQAYDQVFVYAEVLDKAGNLVPLQHLPVQFTIDKPAHGLRRLNPEPMAKTERGIATMLVEVIQGASIEVNAEGLIHDRLTIELAPTNSIQGK